MPISRGRLGGSMGSCRRFPGHRPRTAPDDSTPRSPAAARGPRPRLHPADLPPLRHPAGAAILTTGRRTVANLLRTAAPLAHGPPHQLPARPLPRPVVRPAPGLRLWPASSCAPAPADRPVILVGDDTVDGHPGRQVYGKARHRDPVRSTHAYTAWRYGHKWVVLAVLVRFPFATRPWALPVLVDLYRSEEDDRQRRRPHRTPAQLMCRLLRLHAPAGSPTAASSSSATPATAPTRSPGSATATAAG